MAARYFVNGGVDNNWGTTGNWSTTNGGAGGSSVPSSSDDAIFTSLSPNCTVNTSARVCLTLTTTGYTNTITVDQNLSVSGAITLGSGMTFAAGAGGIVRGIITASHTFNGVNIPNFGFGGVTATHTLADNATCVNFYPANTNQSFTINGNQVNVSGNLDLSGGSSGTISGTSIVNLTGTGSLSLMSTTGVFRLPITFNNGSNTFTLPTGDFRYNTGTLTYTSGTIANAINCTINSGNVGTNFATGTSIVWGGGTLSGGVTYDCTGDFSFDGTLTLGAGSSQVTFNNGNVYCKGSLVNNCTTGAIKGTTVFIATDTVTFSAPSLTTGEMQNPITIAAGSGTLTVVNPFRAGLGLLKYTSGTVITDSGTWASSGGLIGGGSLTGGMQ